jgi:hypothetical protein
MANKIIHDSGSWASLWVKQYDCGTDAGALPAINSIVKQGGKVGVVIDTPRLGLDGHYWCTIDTAAMVRVTGISGTGTNGQTVFLTSGGAVTLTVGTNTPIGYLDQAKAATGDDLYLQLVPGVAIAPAAS